jgi:translocation and assembly module TamB
MKPGSVKRIARRFLTVAIVAAGVLAALFTMATTPWFQTYLEHRITASLQDLTGGRVEMAGFHFRPLRLEVDVGRLTIHGREAAADPPMIVAQNIEARVNPASLIQFRLLLRSFRWARAAISLRIMPDGGINLPGPAAPSGLAEAVGNLLDLSSRKIQLDHTEIAWNSKHLPVDAAASNLTLVLHGRPGNQYEGHVSASVTALGRKFRSIPAVSFDSRFTLGRTALDVPSFRWNTKMLSGTAAASFEWSPAAAGDFKFTAQGGMAQIFRALRIQRVRDGQVELEGKGEYRGDSLNVSGKLRARRLDLQMPGLRPVMMGFSADYSLDRRQVTLSRLSAELFKGRLEGSGLISLRGAVPEYKFRGRARGIDLESFVGGLSASHPTLQVLRPGATVGGAVDATWRGALEHFRSNFDFALEAPAKPGPGVLPVTGRLAGSVEYGRAFSLTVKAGDLKTPHSTIEAHGKLAAGGPGLQLRVETTDFEEWRPFVRLYTEPSSPISLTLAQPASFSGTFAGTLEEPAIKGRVEAGRFEYQGWQWDGFQAEVNLAADEASISSATLRHGSSVFKINATASLEQWRFEPDSKVHVDLSASRSPIGALRAAFGIKTPLEGLISGELSVDGTRRDLEGKGTVEISQGRIAAENFDFASARFDVSHSAWSFEDVLIRKGKARVTGSASVELNERKFSANLHGKDLQVGDLFPAEPKQKGAQGTPPLRGIANFDIRAEGSFDKPQGTLDAALTGLQVYGQPLGQAKLRAGIQGSDIEVSAGATGPGGDIKLSAQGQTTGEWPVKLAGTFSHFRVDPWIDLFSKSQMEPPISAGGSFSASGPLKKPAQLAGRGTIQTMEITLPNLSLRNESPVELAYSHRTLSIGALRLRGPGTNFEAQGAVEFGANPSVSLTATGQADAALLRLIDPELQASGDSSIKVHMGGTLAAPRVQGALTVNDVTVGFGNLPFRLSRLNGTIELQGDKAVISNMTGTVGAGTVNLSGSIRLGRLPRYEIRAGLEQVRVRYPAEFTSVLDGGLTLRGTAEGGRLDGDLVLRNVFVSENFDIFNLVAGGGSAEEPELPASLASRIDLNVRVTSSPAVQIETRNVRLISDVDLRVRGNLAQPVVLGTVQARSGSAIFRGNRYAITRGDITYSNQFRTEPVLDLEAQTRVQSYDLSIQVSGPFDRLRFSYRSDPPLPVEDILSLLAFSQPQRSQSMGTGNSRSFSSVGASALLSEALSSQISGRIQELFGVSRVKIAPSPEDLPITAGPVVTVEQQPSPDLTITYSTSTGNSQYRVIQFEWDVSQNMSIVGVSDYNGVFGLELRFRKRFK